MMGFLNAFRMLSFPAPPKVELDPEALKLARAYPITYDEAKRVLDREGSHAAAERLIRATLASGMR